MNRPLQLSTLEWSDFDDILALRSDPEIMRSAGEGKPRTTSQVHQQKHGMRFYSVFQKDHHNFVRQAGLFHLGYDDIQSEIELAYRFHKKFWGKGYATKAAIALVKWGFEHLKLDKIIGAAYPDNISSQNVLKKAGFELQDQKPWYNGQEIL